MRSASASTSTRGATAWRGDTSRLGRGAIIGLADTLARRCLRLRFTPPSRALATPEPVSRVGRALPLLAGVYILLRDSSLVAVDEVKISA